MMQNEGQFNFFLKWIHSKKCWVV